MGVVNVEFLLIVIRQGEFEVSQKAGWNEEEAGTDDCDFDLRKNSQVGEKKRE
jgi:hypothetical protein